MTAVAATDQHQGHHRGEPGPRSGAQMPDQIALREKDFGIWQEVTWADYWN